MHNLVSTGVPFPLTTVQVPNLALTHKSQETDNSEGRSMLRGAACPGRVACLGNQYAVEGEQHNRALHSILIEDN